MGLITASEPFFQDSHSSIVSSDVKLISDGNDGTDSQSSRAAPQTGAQHPKSQSGLHTGKLLPVDMYMLANVKAHLNHRVCQNSL